MDFGLLLLRLVVGGAFVGHGVQKLSTALDGHGFEGTVQMMDQLEMKPARTNAAAAAASEVGGGTALILGAATPLAATGLIATMVTAITKVHAPKGPWNSAGGYEYNAVLIAAVTAIASAGPGRASIDALFGKSRWGGRAGVFALAAGAAGAAAAIYAGRRTAAAERWVAQSAPADTEVTDDEATAAEVTAAE